MSTEIPAFSTSIEDSRVIVTATHSRLAPPVLFDMLTSLSLRGYNITTPKERNMYLRELDDRLNDRWVETELTPYDAKVAMNGLITHFAIEARELQDVSERQWHALVDHATRRTAADYPQA